MQACKTNVARALGYIGKVSAEDRVDNSPVIILGPSRGEMRSYHQSESSFEIWKRSKEARKELNLSVCRRLEFRL